MEPITLGLLGLAAFAAWKVYTRGEAGAKQDLASPSRIIPPTLPIDPELAHRLAPQVAADVAKYLGFYDQALVASFKEAAGLRGRAGRINGVYAGMTRGALAYYGVQNPPNPLPGKLPSQTITYRRPAPPRAAAQTSGALHAGVLSDAGALHAGVLSDAGTLRGAGVGASTGEVVGTVRDVMGAVSPILGLVSTVVKLAGDTFGGETEPEEWNKRIRLLTDDFLDWTNLLAKLDVLGETYPNLRVRGSDRIWRYCRPLWPDVYFNLGTTVEQWHTLVDFARYPWTNLSQAMARAWGEPCFDPLIGLPLISPEDEAPGDGRFGVNITDLYFFNVMYGQLRDRFGDQGPFIGRDGTQNTEPELQWCGWTTDARESGGLDLGMEETNRLMNKDFILKINKFHGTQELQRIAFESYDAGVNDKWRNTPVDASEWTAERRAVEGRTIPMAVPPRGSPQGPREIRVAGTSLGPIPGPRARIPFSRRLYGWALSDELFDTPNGLLRVGPARVAAMTRGDALLHRLNAEQKALFLKFYTPLTAAELRALPFQTNPNLFYVYSPDREVIVCGADIKRSFDPQASTSGVVVAQSLAMDDSPQGLAQRVAMDLKARADKGFTDTIGTGPAWDRALMEQFQVAVGLPVTRAYDEVTRRALVNLGILEALLPPAKVSSSADALASLERSMMQNRLALGVATVQQERELGLQDKNIGLPPASQVWMTPRQEITEANQVTEASKMGLRRDSPEVQQAIKVARGVLGNSEGAKATFQKAFAAASKGDIKAQGLVNLVAVAMRGPEDVNEA